jgi:hypothetical protein
MTKATLYDGRLEIDFDAKAHAYTANLEGRDAGPIDGVTGIIGRARGMGPALVGWRGKMQHEYALQAYLRLNEEGAFPEEIKELKSGPSSPFIKELRKSKSAWRDTADKAANVGKRVHAFAEAYAGEDIPESDDEQFINGCAAVKQFFDESNFETISCERIVASIEHWFCGTCDRLIKIDDRLAVMDFKTSKPFVNDWNGPYFEMALQLAAYAIALEEELNQEIHDGYIVRLDKATGRPESHRVQLSRQLKNAWLNVRGIEKAEGDLTRIWTNENQIG